MLEEDVTIQAREGASMSEGKVCEPFLVRRTVFQTLN